MSKLYVYLFCSRNKDNKSVDGFKQRYRTIVEYEENEDKVLKKYHSFVNEGKPGELSRLYKSVNSRDESKVRKALVIKLISEEPSVTGIETIVASVAEATENRAESKWLFDFDIDDETSCALFVKDVIKYGNFNPSDVFIKETPHGYAIVVPHGFDTRELLDQYRGCDITLKRDDMLFVTMEETPKTEK